MPLEGVLDPPVIRLHVRTPFTIDEIEDALQELWRAPAFAPGMMLLAEIEGKQNTPSGEVRRYAAGLSALQGKLHPRMAIVTDNDLSFGLSRMFAMFAEPYGFEVGVFRDPADAEQWLLSSDDGGGLAAPIRPAEASRGR